MKNLCDILRQNIVQKASKASIRRLTYASKQPAAELFMSIDKCIKALLYFLNLRLIKPESVSWSSKQKAFLVKEVEIQT